MKAIYIKGIYKGAMLAVPLLALSISSFIAGRRIGQNKQLMKIVITFGMALLTVSFVVIRIQHSFTFLILFLIISGVRIGVSLPALDALITEGVQKEERGTIISIYSSMRFIEAGPPVYAYIMSVGDHWVYYVSAGVSLFAVLIVLFFIKHSKQSKPALKHA
ncbi:MFS transporter [Bacillus sp. V2I10]|uniref:MFS transporter n=1 Tax=Bacillus sp. V2I10 TaxID=3042276 RepID=UPI002787740E|nr:MFS transporter [Bacillus sp. V2I10]MDQ0860062.1 sugar phosphate permease [Bacillus sp. V2I10]